jgi:hypothetical protein
MHDRFRSEQQHHQGGDGQCAHRQCRTIEQHAEQHHPDHDERPLRRYLIAGQNEINASDQKGGERRFLIGARSARPGIKGKESADHEKDHAGDYRHVKPDTSGI